MSGPSLQADSKRATTGVVVELSRSQVPPILPFELRDYVPPHTWEIRLSALARIASQYCRPTFERTYLVIMMVLTFLLPITTYYITLQALEDTTGNINRRVWFARFSCFAVAIATWIVLSTPVIVWRYLGNLRMRRLADQWTRSDALSARSYGEAAVWKVNPPGLFREAIQLTVTVPLTRKSHFDRDSCLPPYIAAGDDGLPSYGDMRMANWSTDFKGGVRFGDLPIYTDKMTVQA